MGFWNQRINSRAVANRFRTRTSSDRRYLKLYSIGSILILRRAVVPIRGERMGGAVARPDCVGNPTLRTDPTCLLRSGRVCRSSSKRRTLRELWFRNIARSRRDNVNAGLAKEFSFQERYHLRFEATFTNVLNHTNFAPPALNVSNSSTFGVLTSTLPQGLGGNRTGQLAMRLDF